MSAFSAACIRKISVPERLPVRAPASTEELIARINAHRNVNGLSVRVGLKVVDYYTGESGKAKSYPEANAELRLQRPEKIRLVISAPIIGTDVADMMSDGTEFRLAVFYPKEKRMFVRGSNVKEYQQLDVEDIKKSSDERVREAGALTNIRPQHITDAFIIPPIPEGGTVEHFREEVIQTEPDERPGKRGKFVDRTYYVLFVTQRNDRGKLILRRKFWFDRTQEGTPLSRQQSFDGQEGVLGTDVSYSGFFSVAHSDVLWPGRVVIQRRNDGYALNLHLDKDSVEVNPVLPGPAFTLENTDQLKEVNLDEPRKTGVVSKPARPTPASSRPK
jgi:hypothetical protein